jgi:hypothetical protein
VTGDGLPDVVVANDYSSTVCVLAGNAAGTLDAAVCYPSGGGYSISVAIGDTDGDGRPDVIVANYVSNTVCVLKGKSTGTLDAAVSYPSGGVHPTAVAVADVNGDGRADVVVTNQSSDTVCVLTSNAGGTLDAAVAYASGGSEPVSVAIGDVNRDGRPDLAVANAHSNLLAVLLDQDTECAISSYGAALPNSTGQVAQMHFTGTPSLGSNSLTLRCAGLPPNRDGLFFFGTQRLDPGLPFGNGLRFVGGSIVRLPVVHISSTGTASFQPDLALPPFDTLVPGDVREFEFWYRDGAAGGAGYNGSNALEVWFCP